MKTTAIAKREKPGALAKWDDELAADAAEQASHESVGSSRLSVRGGQWTVGGNPLKNKELSVIVLASTFENVYYLGKYDADAPTSPVCYAFGVEQEGMAPHEKSPEPQCETCAACERNQFGTADTGRGKACKNTKRLMIISGADATPQSVADAEALMFAVPVTSVKAWAHYVKGLASTYRRPPYAVVTEMVVEPDAQTQFKIGFRFVSLLGDEFAAAIKARRGDVAEQLVTPYAPPSERPVAAPARGRGAPAKPARRDKF